MIEWRGKNVMSFTGPLFSEQVLQNITGVQPKVNVKNSAAEVLFSKDRRFYITVEIPL